MAVFAPLSSFLFLLQLLGLILSVNVVFFLSFGRQQCYKEIQEGMYGALGKTMEGCNQWYAEISVLLTRSII